jgi:hypothetical protein
MPQEVTAEFTAEVTLDWLSVLNSPSPQSGRLIHDYTKLPVPVGSKVYSDPANRRFRVTHPDGKVVAWDQLKSVRIQPEQNWGICWYKPETSEYPSFGFAIEEGKLCISLEQMEGHEDLFADFVATMNDPDLCPGGFRAADGRYESNMLVDFMVTWGGDGVPPSLAPVKETLTAPLNVPWQFAIELFDDTEVDCFKAKRPVIVPAGFYLGNVGSYNYQTGEVRDIRFITKHLDHVFSTTAEDLFGLLGSNEAEMVAVFKDKKPQY